jgi:UDP-N-acetylmuramyl pentapeptide phosphotransferase/UDP-N-acetylglucosamine-1-phosphate transferase
MGRPSWFPQKSVDPLFLPALKHQDQAMQGAFFAAIGPYLLLAGLCAALSFATIKLLMSRFKRYALARPNARSSHRSPTPQGGGAAVVLACLVGCLGAAFVWPGSELASGQFAVLALATILLAAIGAIDDLRPLPVLPRLAVQGVAAALGVLCIIAASNGAMTDGVDRAVFLVLVFGLIWFVNLTNFMDGIDGITLAEFLPLLASLVALSIAGPLGTDFGIIAAALFGGLLGFAPYNRHVAKLFLGDVGSLAIGFIAGCLLLRLALTGHPVAALILPMYYLADATLTLCRRGLKGERISEAHRSHFYQRATDLGWRVPEITGLIVKANFGLGLLALISAQYDTPLIQVAALACASALTVWLLLQLSRAPQR